MYTVNYNNYYFIFIIIGVIVHAATISIYNLKNDTLIRQYIIPAAVVAANAQAGLQNIAIDVNSYACDDAHAYISNTLAPGLAVVYRFVIFRILLSI